MSENLPPVTQAPSPSSNRREWVNRLLCAFLGSGLTVGGVTVLPPPPAPAPAPEVFTFTPTQMSAARQGWFDQGRADALREIKDAFAFDRVDRSRNILERLSDHP